jgi:hypothetical protein
VSAVVTLQDNLDTLPPMSDRIEAGNGSYWRDAGGVWRYTLNGEQVPGAQDVYDAAGAIVSMIAPELAPELLLDVDLVAARWEVKPDTVYRYVHDGRLPPPQIKVGHCNAWTAPIVDMAHARRPGQGWRRGQSASSRPGTA